MRDISGSKPRLTFDDAVEVWRLRQHSTHQHTIAAKFGVNSGRASEVLTEKKHLGSWAAAEGVA